MNSKILLQYIWEEPASAAMFGDIGPHKVTFETDAGANIFQFITLVKHFVLASGYSEQTWRDGLEYALEEYTNDELLNVSREEKPQGLEFTLGK